MRHKLIGILTITSIAILAILVIITGMSGEFVQSSNIQLIVVFFGLSIVLTGMYLLNTYCPQSNPVVKKAIVFFGFAIFVLNALAIYNYIDFLVAFNWIISGVILYILLVQLQLLNWGNQTSILTKLLSVILVLSNLTLIIFFIAKWSYSDLSMLINIAMLTSLTSFFLGLVFVKNKEIEA